MNPRETSDVTCPNPKCERHFPVAGVMSVEEVRQHIEAAAQGKDHVIVQRWCPFCKEDQDVRVQVISDLGRGQVPERHGLTPLLSRTETPLRFSVSSSGTSPTASSLDISLLELPPAKVAARLFASARERVAAGRTKEAFDLFQRAASAAQRAGADRDRALILIEWARTSLEYAGDRDEAWRNLDEALRLLGDDRDPRYQEAMRFRKDLETHLPIQQGTPVERPRATP